jgi:uncharacterized cupredoxin-like copper-binding protein
MRRTPTAAAILFCVLGLVAAGCGSSDDDDGGSSSGSGTSTTVTARDLSFSTKKIAAKPGKLTVTLDNQGQAPHEFVVLKTDAAPDSLKTKDGKVEMTGDIGEIPETDGGATNSGDFDLKPGHYVFICNVPTHYQAGMAGEIDVK